MDPDDHSCPHKRQRQPAATSTNPASSATPAVVPQAFLALRTAQDQPHVDDEVPSLPSTINAERTARTILAKLGLSLPDDMALQPTADVDPIAFAFLADYASTLQPPISSSDEPNVAATSPTESVPMDALYFAALDSCPLGETINYNSWHACIATTTKSKNPDILTQSKMLHAEDSAEFVKHQSDEIDGLQKAKAFKYLKRSALPEGAEVLNSIWSYRQETTPRWHAV